MRFWKWLFAQKTCHTEDVAEETVKDAAEETAKDVAEEPPTEDVAEETANMMMC